MIRTCIYAAKDYLQTMGNAVADMLHPFGIDVDISVEHKGERSKCPGTTQTQPEDISKSDNRPSASATSQEPEKDISDEQSTVIFLPYISLLTC